MIPIIDISPLLSLSESNEDVKLKVSQSIRHACETIGFFQIIGHGINEQLIDAMIIETKRFFYQSSEEKHKYAVHKWNQLNKNTYRGYFPSSVNGKEGLDMSLPYRNSEHELVKQGDPLHELNLWPTNQIINQYWDEMWRISIELMRSIARSFDLNVSYFDTLLDDRSMGGCGTVSTLRLNYYPLNENQIPVSIGKDDGQPLSCEEHCDGSIFTLLYQHEIGGLQVKMFDGTWIDVPVVPYGIVVNTGNCLERWTNGYLKAINHRVKLLKEERISIPFFLEPCYSTLIQTLPTISNQSKYSPIKYGEYITQKYRPLSGSPQGEIINISQINSYYIQGKDETSKEKAIILLTDVFGLTKNPCLTADEISQKSGFDVYVPDLFNGEPIPSSLLKIMPEAPVGKLVTYSPWLFRHRQSVTLPLIERFIKTLRSEKGINRIESVGYCFGRLYTMLLGSKQIHLVDAIVGCHISQTNKNHFQQIHVPAAFDCAQEDEQFSDQFRKEAQNILAQKKGYNNKISSY